MKFKDAVESGDIEQIAKTFAEDIVFNSPAAHAPYHGYETVKTLIGAVIEVFEDFKYVQTISEGADHALIFEARVGERKLTGCDFIHLNSEGLIDNFTVMVRPLSGLTALAQGMSAHPAVVALMKKAASQD